ncbi:hypothetical protein ACA910_000297 [Epithemia clementina (nom. ined.)]
MSPHEWAVVREKRDLSDNHENPYNGATAIPPQRVTAVERFKSDVKALESLTSSPFPPRILVRPNGPAKAAIMFGDAPGTGFGTSLWLHGTKEVKAEHGVWTLEYSQGLSNFRELYNLVARVDSLVTNGSLGAGTELFVFIDNSTAESAFHKGTSRSKLLCELVLRLKCLEMTGAIFVHVVWVAGTRMIAQGTDELSRGDLIHGVLAGMDMLRYVPLNKSPEERQPGMVAFFTKTAAPSFWFTHLDSCGWFEEAFTQGHYVWTPPPAAADVALKKLC